ncbi:unnamed protein product [Rotaria sp. Silwood2]|nr:unnamed protein product [Rotaria sp. Silwood2]CAF4185327.1 unnamed protein product [Rotaria sp. Silwood2]
MPNNEETLLDELINKAKEGLSNALVGPGYDFSDVIVHRFNYKNNENYYISIHASDGIIMTHPSERVKNDIIAIMQGRTNVLADSKIQMFLQLIILNKLLEYN